MLLAVRDPMPELWADARAGVSWPSPADSALVLGDMRTTDNAQRVPRGPASRRGEFVASGGLAVAGGMALGGGIVGVGLVAIAAAACGSLMAANSDRSSLRSDAGDLVIDTGWTTTRAPWARVERLVVGANPGRVYVQHRGRWRLLRLAVMGESLAKPQDLRGALEDLVSGTDFTGRVEMGRANTLGPRARFAMMTVDIVRWPPRIVWPRRTTWWWALFAVGVGGIAAIAMRLLLDA